MKLKQTALAVGLIVAASSASALTLDFRHEYRADTTYTKTDGSKGSVDERHQSRVKIGESFKINSDWKHSTSLEIKFHSDDKKEGGSNSSQFMQDLYVYGMELDNTATYKIDKNWYLQVGMPIAWDWDEPEAHNGSWMMKKVTYKPQFRLGYKANMGLTNALRLRMEFADFRDDRFADSNMETGEKLSMGKKAKWTYTGAYKIKALPKLGLSWEGNYVKSLDNVKLYDGKDWEWDFGVKVAYKLGNWTPFAELWSTDISSSSDDREAKYRLGIKYKF
ncbi:oligogalacturonate-specific porin KdgM family protein [Vibrio hippocampi]|uniref:Oligogalacturonate-specific porin KdgM n=1 Tax=Vibrio hippocampi TaxID=654686 RepID=A0ABM8ZKD8_9VIBR|nr:oligogalacturonate-specific porin KdgM family protein [Vibrio hippocampi]CAH0528717.1 Oligogalacturonate-specific porin KdgM [Vibrio hippocampi]